MSEKTIRHTYIINRIIQARGYQSYLEIGLGNGRNHQQIRCNYKEGVDPSPPPGLSGVHRLKSDRFFTGINTRSFDFIFVDGLHERWQVLRDIFHSLAILNTGGMVMVHDCYPKTATAQQHPRKVKAWNGDVWRAWLTLRSRSDIEQYCIIEDHGCGMIQWGEQQPLQVNPDMSYRKMMENKSEFLNLIAWNDYENNCLHG